MSLYRPDKFDSAGETVSLETAPAVETAASGKAKALRARALRYRQLCAILYNQDLVAEVKRLVRIGRGIFHHDLLAILFLFSKLNRNIRISNWI